MNKTELARALAHRMHLGDDAEAVRTAAEILTHLFDEDGIIALKLASGDDVTITGFGTFGTDGWDAYTMKNPRNPGGVRLDVPSGRRATFRAGEALKRAVQYELRLYPIHR